MTVETEIKYAGYIDQQRRQIERMQSSDSRSIPDSMAFTGIPGISREVGEKLERVRPATLGQAARIPGRYAGGGRLAGCLHEPGECRRQAMFHVKRSRETLC